MNIWMIGVMGLIQLYGSEMQTGAVTFDRSVVYKTVGEESVVLDLFRPAESDSPVPAVVFIHGGAWGLNSRSDYYDFARGMAREGFVAITPEIRSAPVDGLFGMIADVKDSIRWLRSNAEALGVDPDRIGIYGSSSGGHMAAVAGTAMDGEGVWPDPEGTSSAVQAAYYLFGVYDFENSNIVRILNVFDPGMPMGIPTEILPVFSPLEYVSGNEPPTYMLHGTRDFMVPPAEARRFRDALAGAGVPVTLKFVQGQGHGFIKTAPWLRPWIFWSVRSFFVSELGNPN